MPRGLGTRKINDIDFIGRTTYGGIDDSNDKIVATTRGLFRLSTIQGSGDEYVQAFEILSGEFGQRDIFRLRSWDDGLLVFTEEGLYMYNPQFDFGYKMSPSDVRVGNFREYGTEGGRTKYIQPGPVGNDLGTTFNLRKTEPLLDLIPTFPSSVN